MKNTILNKSSWIYFSFLGAMLIGFLFTGCSDDDSEGGTITVNSVYLEDVNSTVPDREVTFARLGQLLRIEGSGFTGLKRIYINGFQTSFNPVYVSDNSLLVRISGDTPTIDAEDDVRNTIRLANDNKHLH